jgi:hypothetical protein
MDKIRQKRQQILIYFAAVRSETLRVCENHIEIILRNGNVFSLDFKTGANNFDENRE